MSSILTSATIRRTITKSVRAYHTSTQLPYNHLQPYTTLANLSNTHTPTSVQLTQLQQHEYRKKIIDLYRRTLHSLPSILQSYHINYNKQLLHAAAQNIKSQYITKHILRSQQNNDIIYDERLLELLLHRGEINLYDMLNGYKTRSQIKQLLQPINNNHTTSTTHTITQQFNNAVQHTTKQIHELVGNVTDNNTQSQQPTLAI